MMDERRPRRPDHAGQPTADRDAQATGQPPEDDGSVAALRQTFVSRLYEALVRASLRHVGTDESASTENVRPSTALPDRAKVEVETAGLARARALTTLLPTIPVYRQEPVLLAIEVALATADAQVIEHGAAPWVELVLACPDDPGDRLLKLAAAAIARVPSPETRARATAKLAGRLGAAGLLPPLRRALADAEAIAVPRHRCGIIEELAQGLPPPERAAAAERARQLAQLIADEYPVACVLADLAAHLQGEPRRRLRLAALQLADRLLDGQEQFLVLAHLRGKYDAGELRPLATALARSLRRDRHIGAGASASDWYNRYWSQEIVPFQVSLDEASQARLIRELLALARSQDRTRTLATLGKIAAPLLAFLGEAHFTELCISVLEVVEAHP